jgi:transposase-like protein
VLQGQGMTIADAVRQIGMTEQAYHQWRKQYGGMWTLLKKVEASCDRYLIAGGTNVEAEWEQGPAI